MSGIDDLENAFDITDKPFRWDKPKSRKNGHRKGRNTDAVTKAIKAEEGTWKASDRFYTTRRENRNGY